MKKIQENLKDNPYIRNDVATTQFTILIEETMQEHEVLKNLQQYEYIHGFIRYPNWTKDADLFGNIDQENLTRLQNSEIFFVLDASVEGYSPIYQVPFFDILHHNCDKYNVSPEQIIFVSANLLDEKNYLEYSKTRDRFIKIFTFNFFEKVAEAPFEWKKLIENGIDIFPNVCMRKVKEDVNNSFKDKYFSSLSRLNRFQRSVATFLLCNHPIREKALISHNKLAIEKPEIWMQVAGLQDYSLETLNTWLSSLPLVVDHANFEKNWAIETTYAHIHHQTLFQVVNETYQSSFNGTSLFYSEKTFRPMICMQPFIIYGQPGCNKYLKNLGYKTYEDWFDLSFDDEPNDTIRYKLILENVSKLCERLDTMSRSEQIDWRFKVEDVLIHNFSILRESAITKNKIVQFLTEKIYGTTSKL